MDRAIDTATAIAEYHHLVPIQREGLREVDHGHWEGMAHKEVEEKFADEYAAWDADPFTCALAGGETGLEVLVRAVPALREIVVAHPGQTVLVVSHKATNRILLANLLGIDLRVYRDEIAQDLACLNVLDFTAPWKALVKVMNDTSHYAAIPS